MKILHWSAAGLCLAAGGCAAPLGPAWDDALDQSIRDRYRASDAARAGLATDQPDGTPATATGIESLTVLSVDDAVRVAIHNTPTLRRAGYRVDIAAGRVTQAGLYPNPSFVFGAEGLGSEGGAGGETTYKIEQEIVLGGKISRARAVAESDQRTAEAAFVAEEFAVASRVSRAYFSAVAARERLTSRRALVELADQLLSAATSQVEAGAATEPDRLRAEVVREQAGIELDAAILGAEASLRSLASAMGIDGSVGLPLTTAPDDLPEFPSRDELAQAVLEANSRVSIARLNIERARRAHELARAEGVPNLLASVGPRYSDIDDETTVDLGLGVEVPLFDRNQGGIRAAIAERLSAAANLRVVQLELLDEVSDAWSAYEAARLATTRYRDQLLPKADKTLDLTRQAYERGKTDYLRLLDAQQVVVESRIASIDATERLHEAAAILLELAQNEAPWRDAPDADASQGDMDR